jgi:prephenate dehydrogenase
MDYSKITVIGLGLIGGSLAWALKRAGNVGEVYGVDIDDGAIDYAIREHIIDVGSKDLRDAVNNSDVVVIATYVGIIPKIAKSLASILSPKTTVTDVGSVKAKVVMEIENLLPKDVVLSEDILSLEPNALAYFMPALNFLRGRSVYLLQLLIPMINHLVG